LKADLITYLNSKSAITDLVVDRIAWDRIEQGTAFPWIVLEQISNDDIAHLLAATGKAVKRIQINVYGTTSLSVANVADAIRTALHGFRGTMGAGHISSCFLDDERIVTEDSTTGKDQSIHGDQQDYLIGHTVTIPTF